jgi:hypothetical protein
VWTEIGHADDLVGAGLSLLVNGIHQCDRPFTLLARAHRLSVIPHLQ